MGSRGKILVIEDNEDWKQLLSDYLKEAGYHVETVTTLNQGLQKIKREMFHFVTIDLQLDEKTQKPSEFEGWDILKKIIDYRANSYMPTMVITGFEGVYEKFSKIKKIHADFHMLKKDFNKEIFINNINRSIKHLDVHFFNDTQ